MRPARALRVAHDAGYVRQAAPRACSGDAAATHRLCCVQPHEQRRLSSAARAQQARAQQEHAVAQLHAARLCHGCAVSERSPALAQQLPDSAQAGARSSAPRSFEIVVQHHGGLQAREQRQQVWWRGKASSAARTRTPARRCAHLLRAAASARPGPWSACRTPRHTRPAAAGHSDSTQAARGDALRSRAHHSRSVCAAQHACCPQQAAGSRQRRVDAARNVIAVEGGDGGRVVSVTSVHARDGARSELASNTR
jgi:hypothetical protein